MGFILAAFIAVVASLAIAIVWRQYRREVRRLRAAHKDTVHELSHEHHRRLERLDREHDRQLRTAHHPLVQDLLPALDSLDDALAHLDSEEASLSSDELVQGLELAREAIYDALARHDITPVCPQRGQPFDPEIHEAISRHETSQEDPHTIRKLFRRGYRGTQGVLRAALVEVNVEPTQPSESLEVDSSSPGEDSSELESSTTDEGSMAGNDDTGCPDFNGSSEESNESDSSDTSDSSSAEPSVSSDESSPSESASRNDVPPD